MKQQADPQPADCVCWWNEGIWLGIGTFRIPGTDTTLRGWTFFVGRVKEIRAISASTDEETDER